MDKLLCNEIRVWRRLEHINVLPLYGTVSNFGPCVSMVCPWQENGNLNQFLEMNPTLASHGRYRILLGVLSGLLYLHSCSVIHGDLTGSNVLLGEPNTVVLSDFGLSTLLSESGTLSHSVSTSVGGRGAVRWAAPEIVIASDDNTIRRPDKSSDTYSFGSITLQALSGHIPYHHLRSDVCVILHLSKGIKPPRPLQPPIKDEIWGLIQNCWDDEPQRRPELTTIERGIQALYVTDGPGAESIMHEGVAPGRPLSCVPDEKVDGPANDSNHHSAAMGPSIFRRLTMRRITSPWAWVPRVLSKMTRQRGSMEMATLKDTNPGLLPGTGTVRQQIGTPDYQGWLRKLDNNSEECWKARFFVLKNSHLYYLRSDSPKVSVIKPRPPRRANEISLLIGK
ncbi:kinase-like domain-containing protein [Infundibulicybe gibba]|nr:kinase-like domain-containing protein [Infundibulicybe gibba]